MELRVFTSPAVSLSLSLSLSLTHTHTQTHTLSLSLSLLYYPLSLLLSFSFATLNLVQAVVKHDILADPTRLACFLHNSDNAIKKWSSTNIKFYVSISSLAHAHTNTCPHKKNLPGFQNAFPFIEFFCQLLNSLFCGESFASEQKVAFAAGFMIHRRQQKQKKNKHSSKKLCLRHF